VVRDRERDRAFDPLLCGDSGDQDAAVVANNATARPGDQRSISASTSLVRAAKLDCAAVGDGANRKANVRGGRARQGRASGRRMVREAEQDECRLTIGITTLQRVKVPCGRSKVTCSKSMC